VDGGVVVSGEFVVSGCDASVVFEPAEHALDPVALPIEVASVREGDLCGFGSME